MEERECNMIDYSKLYRVIPDKLYLEIMYKRRLGKKLNLKNPTTFNEKIQWLKLYDRKPIYTTMVDKYEAKKYVADIIGDQYIVPTFGLWEHFDDIDFDLLPDRFVLKCTHDSGGLVICKDKSKLDISSAKKKIDICLKRNYFWGGREWPYKNVKPRILAEEYLEDSSTHELRDYKFFAFNGKVKCFKVDYDRYSNHKANYYDVDGNRLPFEEAVCPTDENKYIDLPVNLTDMIKISEKLSQGIPLIRVDLYNNDHKVYFGELTLYPASGFGIINPEEWDSILGRWMQLPV